MGDQYTPKVGDVCWYWAGEMNLPLQVTVVETVANPMFVGHEDTTNPFIERDRTLYRIRRVKGQDVRRLHQYPVLAYGLFPTLDEARKWCRAWHQFILDWKRDHPNHDSKRQIASTKRRLRELEALSDG